MSVYIVHDSVLVDGKTAYCFRVTAETADRVTLIPGESLAITFDELEIGVEITCFKKGDPPKVTWEKWPERIRRWISFNPRMVTVK